MYCVYCGAKNKVDSTYCKACGKKMPKEKEYAGFWIRFGAYFIDFIGMLFTAFIIGVIMALLGISSLIDKIGILFDYLIWVIYSTFFLSIWSVTPGKKVYGLKVLTEEGQRLGLKTSFTRALLQPISLLFFGVGYWNMDKNSKRQAWHDRTVHTIVERENSPNLVIPIVLSVIGLIAYFYLRSLNNAQ